MRNDHIQEKTISQNQFLSNELENWALLGKSFRCTLGKDETNALYPGGRGRGEIWKGFFFT